MESYSQFELALGGIVFFSASIFVGCVSYFINKPSKPIQNNKVANKPYTMLPMPQIPTNSNQKDQSAQNKFH
jgi:hypothetical protein